jgi:hypothetical protein
MTIDRIDLINKLEKLFQFCFDKEKSLIKHDKLIQTDARVSFYKHLNNTIDASIHLLIVTHKYMPDDKWWNDIQDEYNITPRSFSYDQIENYVIEFRYIEQHLAFSYFLLVFHTFESSFRVLFKANYPDEYFKKIKEDKMKHRDFNSLITDMISKSRMIGDKERKNFIEIMLKYRNSIHTNGVFLSPLNNSKRKSYSKSIVWNKNTYDFNNGSSIWKDDLWLHYILFTYEFIKIFEEISNSIPDKSTPIIDISEITNNKFESN